MKGYGVNVHETKSQFKKAMEQRFYDCSSS
jgi:hypothetical protein